MSTKNLDEKLAVLLDETYEGGENGTLPPLRENRIYINRNLKLARVQAIGFDMDYTLAVYKQEALEKLTMRIALETLVRDHGYPDDIVNIPYNGDFAIRGLVMDTELGNVLKMDKFRYVSLAYHGLGRLSSEKRSELYNTGRISLRKGRYRAVDTLFEILEAYLYAALIEFLEGELGRKVDYQELYTHLRGAIDLCHRDGSLKKEIMTKPQEYIQDDPLLIPTLHNFKEAGRKLFVLTNSEPHYTEFVLNFLFRNSRPYFTSWRQCFDLVGSSSCKPSFFYEGNELKVIEDTGCLFFSGGNLDFLEDRLGAGGDEVLYVGDHIYGDILKTKHTSSWRTCIIVPELKFQVRAEAQAKPFLQELDANETRRKQLSMELNWRRNQVLDLHQFKEAESDDLDLEHLKKIDRRVAVLNRQLEKNNEELSKLLYASRDLRRKISNAFNPFWGRLFKTGGQLSIFAEQIRDYACIYTSQVSNFNFYNSQSYMQSVVTPMPHEDELYPVNNLNFDSSLDSRENGEGAPAPQLQESV